MRGFYGVFSGSGEKSMSKKPEYQDLVDILKKIVKTSKIESVLGTEWVNYPIEVYDELLDILVDVELENE